MKNYFRCKGFTLAEVLITLAIIGVVAALTIPTLIQKYQEQAWITGTKKFYNVMSRAVQMAVLDNGLPETWDLSDPENMIKPLMPYLKIAEYCTSKNGKVCYNSQIHLRDGSALANESFFNGSKDVRPAFRLSDGTNVGVYTTPNSKKSDSTICGEYLVDVNGAKGPNTFGKDMFIFYLVNNGTIKPYGTPDFHAPGYTFDTGCLDNEGFACSGWVVINGNMDYLHCPDELSWEGKHKCD